jgi:DNA-binding NarL/FixJ family response regulator
MSAAAPTRVIIADDDPFARRVIKSALQAGGVTVIAEAKNGREAVQLALHYGPDIVLMDVVMPELDGIIATRQILKADPEQLVVVLTGANEEEFGLLALRAGAVGFLSKEADIAGLARALAGVLEGEAAISREMTRRLIDRYRGTAEDASGMRPIKSPLTAREWEVIELLKPGRTTDAVAETLVLSPETVRSHIKNIMRKLNVHSRADAVAAAEHLRIAAAD